MANKASNSRKQVKVINYSGRDFQSIRNDLLEYVKRYYPDSYKDFNSAGFGSLMLDTVSYMGDVLSFYLDYQVNETFLDTATEYENVIKIARQLGYKYADSFSSSGLAQFFVSVPADVAGAPSEKYLPTLKVGSEFLGNGGQVFTLTENINFADPNNQIVVNKVNSATGNPTQYAVRAIGTVISGKIERQVIEVGAFEKFRKIFLTNAGATEITRVYDSEGHRYYEVDHLAQEIVFKAIKNNNTDKNTVPSILKAIPVTRRFVLERDNNNAWLQFGYGSESELTNASVVDPSQIALKLHGRDYTTQQDFDPTNLTSTDKFGVGPANTTLTVLYRINDSADVNIAANSLTQVQTPLMDFSDRASLNQSSVRNVIKSLEVNNDEPIVGSISLPSTEELKQRVYTHFAAQNRAVTENDYKALVYAMPPSFGAVHRCSIQRDFDSFKRNLNMYLISKDSVGKLERTNTSIKNNIKTWLSNYKMINDTIDVLDAQIVNFGINFSLVADLSENKYNVLNLAVQRLTNYFSNQQYDISEPIYITDVYKELQQVPSVVDVLDVQFVRKEGGVYSNTSFSFEDNLSADGRYLNGKHNTIFEIRFPESDIQGSIT